LTLPRFERCPNAEALVKTALLESTGPALDRRLFNANPAVPDLRPPGLLHGLSPLTPSASATKDDAMRDDLQALLTAIAPVAGGSGIVLIAAPGQAVSIALRTLRPLAYRVLPSSALAAGSVIAAVPSAIAAATADAPLLDTTQAASVQMNDAPSGDLMTGGAVTATFQTDTIGLRMRLPVTWALRDARGVSFMTGVTW
jgi:hypothetical protein